MKYRISKCARISFRKLHSISIAYFGLLGYVIIAFAFLIVIFFAWPFWTYDHYNKK